MMSKAALLSMLLVAVAAPRASAQPGAQQPTPGPTVIIVEPGAPLPGPPPTAAASPAPQNEPWNNVSHINGTPVPVGQRNDYLYQFRRTNISANPVAWAFDVYGFSIAVAVSNNVAIHGDITFYGNDWGDAGATELSIGAPIYFRRTFQGPFLEPGVLSRDWESGSQAGPFALLGWHWMYESGLNLAVAFGAGRDVTGDDEYSDSEPFPAGYLRVGYAF